MNPYGCLDNASKLGDEMRPHKLRLVIKKRVRKLNSLTLKDGCLPLRACSYLFTAELMKRVGDYRALQYYHLAIASEPREPAYDLFLAEYLRVFRGAGSPQFPRAEHHYYQARAKLAAHQTDEEWDVETLRRIHRGMIALYEVDGVAIQRWNPPGVFPFSYPTKPYFLFSSVNTYGIDPNDIPEIDDVRDFTSEAMFSASGIRLNRSLTQDEFRSIARAKGQFESINRLRLRPGSLPVIDFTYRTDNLQDAQITNFFLPAEFNDVDVDEFAVAASHPWMTHRPSLDWFGRVEYKRIRRVGVIEFLPAMEDEIDHFEGNLAIKRFVGPDAIMAEGTVVYQDIASQIPNPPRRDRLIAAGVLRYFLFRQLGDQQTFERNPFDSRFDPRGIEFFGGVLHDCERFGDVNVTKNDYFLGGAIRGFEIEHWRPMFRSFDLTVQGTVFDSNVEGDPFQDNAQYRTNVTLLGRIKDEEQPPEGFEDLGRFYPAFIHLVATFKHDVRLDGIDEFENWSLGVQLNAKLYNTDLNGTTFLLSAGYAHQSFYRLDKHLDLFRVNVSMGF